MKTLRIAFKENDPIGMPTILQRELWDSSLETLTHYLPEEKDFFAYLRGLTATCFKDRRFRVEGENMVFDFDGDFASFARHALSLIVAARQETLQKLAEHHEIELVRLEALREALMNVEDTFDESLAAIEGGMCQCPICLQLRPVQAFETRWITALESDDAAEAEQASFFVLNAAEPSSDALRALAGASVNLGEYRLRRALYHLGKRLPGDRFTAIQQAIETSRNVHEAAGLVAVFSGLEVDVEMRFDALREHFDADSPAAETAIEFLGYGEVPAARRDELADELAERVGRNDDVDYAIAITLYNVFREIDYPPSKVKSTLEELRGARGEAADVAQRAMAWFDSRR